MRRKTENGLALFRRLKKYPMKHAAARVGTQPMYLAWLRNEHHARQKRPGPSIQIELHATALADRDFEAHVTMEDRTCAHGIRPIDAQDGYAIRTGIDKIHDTPGRRIYVFAPCIWD